MDMTKITQQIKKVRKEEGLTQEQFAEKLETTKSVISEIERGKRNIGIATIIRIAKTFNRTINDNIFEKK